MGVANLCVFMYCGSLPWLAAGSEKELIKMKREFDVESFCDSGMSELSQSMVFKCKQL